MVSFCDRPMSVVRRPSCVVHNFFKHLLLLNHWASLDETWQGCFFGEAVPKLFKRLNSNHNSGCHGNQNEKNSKIFENLMKHLLVDLYHDWVKTGLAQGVTCSKHRNKDGTKMENFEILLF